MALTSMQKRALPELLRELVKIDELEWIRLHYAYPTGFPEEVIELMASEEKICNYLDIPIQHVNDGVLSAMGRGHDRKKLEQLATEIPYESTRCGTSNNSTDWISRRDRGGVQ